MSVVNKICNDCDKSTVCNWCTTINKFDDEIAKNPIGATIEIKNCPEFKEV